MIVWWGSHTKRYVPFFSFTVHFVVPVPGTLVFLLTPGPVRWKSWIDARSRMVIVYVPALTVFLFIVIVKPGPTVPVSVFAFVAANVELASASVARTPVKPMVIGRMGAPWVAKWRTQVCREDSVAARRSAPHPD